MRKIKTGDEVIVTTGKSKGARGKILRVTADGLRVIVEGANLIKKHVKPNPNTNTKGGIVEKEAALNISNVAIFNSVTQRPDRIGIKILEDGRRVRYFKSNGELIEVQ